MLREKELILLENLKKENARKTEEIHQLRNNQLIGQVSGEETATITDGALAFANILEETEIEVAGEKRKAYIVKLPQGLIKQKKRTGYNLLNLENEGKEITLDYTSEYSMKYENCKVEQTLKAGTYTLALKVKSLANGSINAVSLKNVDTTVATFSGYTTTTTTEKFFIKTITVDTDVTFNRISLQNAQIGTYIIKEIIILEGTYTAENLPEYEEYGRSPSIEYPSPIKNIRAWNLFNKDKITESVFINSIGTLTDSLYSNVSDYIEIDSNKNFYLVYNYEILSSSIQREYCIYDNDKQIISSGIYNPTSSNKQLLKKVENAKYIRITLDKNMTDIMVVEEKDANKPYAPYNVITISSENKNKNTSVLEEGGLNLGINSITQVPLLRSKEFVKIKPNTNYAFSVNEKLNKVVICMYDKNKKYISIDGTVGKLCETGLFKSYENAYYIRYRSYAADYELFKNGKIQLEEGISTTSYIEHQSQIYPLHIGVLELNGIDDIRDSFVVELNDPSASAKSIKKLYKREIFESEQFFNGNEGWFLQNNIQQKTNRFAFDNFVNNEGISLSDFVSIISNKFKNYSANQLWIKDIEGIAQSRTQIIINVDAEKVPDLATFKQLLATEKIRYVCRKDEELIDLTDNTELVKEVEYLINNFKTFKEVTHVEVDNGYIDLEYVKSTELALKNIQQQIDNISALMLEGGTGNA